MNNYANSLDDAGRKEEALQLRRENFELRKAALGPSHPDTLTAMSNYAISFKIAGRKEEALQLRREIFELSKAALGPSHPDTLTAMSAALGPSHPDTLTAMSNYANSLDDAGRKEVALQLRRENFELRKAALGPSHP